MRECAVLRLWKGLRNHVIRRRFVQDVGSLTVANFAGAVLSFIQVILVARWLGPEQFGIAALVMSYPALLFAILNARSTDTMVKYLSEFSSRGEAKQSLAMCKLGYAIDLCVALVALLLVGVTASWAEVRVVHMPGSTSLLLVYALAFVPRALVGTSTAVLSVFGRFQTLAWVDLLTTALRVAIVLGLVLGGWGVAGVIWGSAAGMVVSGILVTSLAYPFMSGAWGTSWLSGFWKDLRGRRREIFRFLFFMELTELLGLFVKHFDIVVLGYFRGPQEAGYYKLARSLGGAVSYLVGPLQSVTYLELVRLSGLGDREALQKKVRRLACYVGVPSGLVAMGCILLIPVLLPTLVGHVYQPAVLAAQILLVGSAMWLTFFWLRPFYIAVGEVRYWLNLGLLNSTLALVIYPIGAVVAGVVGVAVARIGVGFVRYIPATINVLKRKEQLYVAQYS